MATVVFPYHQDERVATDSIEVPDHQATTWVAPPVADGDRWQRLVGLYDALATEVAASLRGGPGRATVVSGDCLAALGTLTGAQRAGLDPSIIWFDAHGDVHTLESSTSGYLGGMALRMALGGDAEKLGVPLGLCPVPEDRAVLVDARDLDPAEVTYLARSAVRRTQVRQVGASDLPDGPVVLHVDLDVIDPSEVPGLRFPAPDGPTSDDVVAAVDRLLASGQVAVLDVACPWFAPADDDQRQRRAALVARLTASSDPPAEQR